MAKKVSQGVVEVPVSLAKLLVSKPEDFKNPEQYNNVQEVSKVLLQALADDAIIWGS